MKKIGKISINPEKVIKNEELVNLRGGYGAVGSSYWECECDGSSKTFYANTCEKANKVAKNFCTEYKCC